MTKYEWEAELKRNLHRLPATELEKVFEYYDEIFEDKIESGMSEGKIIAQFGNPVDVADKILSEAGISVLEKNGEVPAPNLFNNTEPSGAMGTENGTASNIPAAKKAYGGNLYLGRVILFAVLSLFLLPAITCIPVFILLPSIIGFSFTLGGAVTTIPSIVLILTNGAPGIVQLAVSLGALGAGIGISVLGIFVVKKGFRILKHFCGGLFSFFFASKYVKEEVV